MKLTSISHCDGVSKVPKTIQTEISDAITSLKIRIARGSGPAIRDGILRKLVATGWSKELAVSNESEMTITSVKSRVGLCLQTGNMARLYADLLKLQKLYVDGSITSAIMIVPSSPTAKQIGDNIAHADRLERELGIFSKVIFVPILLFAIE